MINKSNTPQLRSSITRLLFAFCITLAATSKAELAPPISIESQQATAAVDERLQYHTTAIVLDFENGTGKTVTPSIRRKIAAQFVGKLNKQHAFNIVLRESEAKKQKQNGNVNAVVLAGVITSYKKRSANVRILVGVEEGISFFDTRIRIDNKKNSGNSLSRSRVDEITMVEETLIDDVRDQGESVKEYVEDAAQYIARRYRSNVKQNTRAKAKRNQKLNS